LTKKLTCLTGAKIIDILSKGGAGESTSFASTLNPPLHSYLQSNSISASLKNALALFFGEESNYPFALFDTMKFSAGG